MQCCRCRDLCDVSRGVDDPCQSAMDVTHEHTRSSLKPDQMAGRSDSKICFGGQLVKENASVSYLGVEAFDSLHHDCRHIGFWVGCGGLLSMNVRAEDGVATLCACPENASGSCIGHKFCCKLAQRDWQGNLFVRASELLEALAQDKFRQHAQRDQLTVPARHRTTWRLSARWPAGQKAVWR